MQLYIGDIQFKGKYADCYTYTAEYSEEGCELCPGCGDWIFGRRWLHPWTIIITKPVYPDFLYGGGVSPFAVSEHFRQLYEQSDLSGITSFEKIDTIRVRHLKENSPSPPDYYIPNLKTGTVKINRELSVIEYLNIEKPVCPIHCPTGRLSKKSTA